MIEQVKHVAIAGNIGAGKTTLTTQLGKHFGWDVHYESADDNPYLSDFYNDMKRWSFNLQIYFLNSRYQQVLRILDGDRTVVQDRTIYEDAYIFAPNLHDMGLMSTRDFENYFALFQTMSSQIKAPDLLIYLRATIPTLVEHIQSRGRDYEGNMSLDYLKRLNERYETWINSYDEGRLLIINADEVDFLHNAEDLGQVVSLVQGELHGLFD
ncbi:MAG: deoxynucleoside kinase [Saprospiraceae bacterium]|nr:deoxynucleoside kinase [Saprospiraceae bacterium]MCB0622523.1 deoxynucleoside kinase [Saprospiraceae bacterium]MCB0678631.1 deoxynucleoside kinase [Saprospiraceae bacterium]MCB0679708.1 deoxynucleoside kinase [Saprospiraceae bacterium]